MVLIFSIYFKIEYRADLTNSLVQQVRSSQTELTMFSQYPMILKSLYGNQTV